MLSANGPDPLIQLGLEPQAMQAVALEKFPEHRWLAVLPRNNAPRVEDLPAGLYLYAPMADQLTSARAISSDQKD